MSVEEARRANRIRKLAQRNGYSVYKDRARSWSVNHCGGFMLANAYSNYIEMGERFDCSLDDIENFFNLPGGGVPCRVQTA